MMTRKQRIRDCIQDFYHINSSFVRAHSRQLMTLTRKMFRDSQDIYDNFTEAEENSDPISHKEPEQPPTQVIVNYEDGHDAGAVSLDAPSLVEATLQPQTTAKAGGRTKKRKPMKKATLSPKIKMPSTRIMKKIHKMKLLMSKFILTRRMRMSRRKRIQHSVRILQNPARRPQCRPFQSWKGSSQPKSVYRSAPKPVPASFSRQLWRRHQSCGTNSRQSKADLDWKRKDSKNAAASVPGDGNNAQVDEEKLYNLAPAEAYTQYNVQSPQDNAVKAWLFIPFT